MGGADVFVPVGRIQNINGRDQNIHPRMEEQRKKLAGNENNKFGS
jgi:hypothetical protein